MPLAIIQPIATDNTPTGHARMLYRVTTYEGKPHSGRPIPEGCHHSGARHGATVTTYHLDDYGRRTYDLHDPGRWHVIDHPALHTTPRRWNHLAKKAQRRDILILPNGARQ